MGGEKMGTDRFLFIHPKSQPLSQRDLGCFYTPRGTLVFFCLLWTGACGCSTGSLVGGLLLSDGLWIAVWTRPSKEAPATEIQSEKNGMTWAETTES